jgi:hypothetical protein
MLVCPLPVTPPPPPYTHTLSLSFCLSVFLSLFASLFLSLSLFASHSLTYPPHIQYAAMVEFMDESIGNITSLLKTEGLYSNTLIWFLSDNGGPNGDAGANNYPLRGKRRLDPPPASFHLSFDCCRQLYFPYSL